MNIHYSIDFLKFSLSKALLYYNGVQYDEKASKDALVSLVRKRILDIDDVGKNEWEPPGESELNWTLPVSRPCYSMQALQMIFCCILHL